MKYYVYVSVTKIEMLYAQLKRDVLETESSLGFDIKILKGEFKEKVHPADNTFSQLYKVTEQLNRLALVGGVDSDKPYIYGTLPMKFGGYDVRHAPIAFWAHSTFEDPFEGVALALAGSSYHLVGERRESGGLAHSHSLTGAMVLWFLENLEDKFEGPRVNALRKRAAYGSGEHLDSDDIANGTWLAATQMSGQTSKYEFFAKVLHRSKWPEGFRGSRTTQIILGSPLYVCLAE